eukprot:scaffold125857_cov35-Tisochrysis_lutea.AAC.1
MGEAQRTSIKTSPGMKRLDVPSCANNCSRKSSFSAPPPKFEERRSLLSPIEPVKEGADVTWVKLATPRQIKVSGVPTAGRGSKRVRGRLHRGPRPQREP